MQEDVTVRLPDELVNYLQALDFEVGGLRVLHTHALNAGVSPEKTEELRQRFQERFAEYQLAKQELWAPYDGQYPKARWWGDFREGVLHIAARQQA